MVSSMKLTILQKIILVFFTALISFLAFWRFFLHEADQEKNPPDPGLRASIEKILDSKLVVDESGQSFVEYAYETEKIVPPKPQEVLEKRSPYSYTEEKGIDQDGNNIYRLVSYSAYSFNKGEDGKWRQVDYATTTKEAFSRAARPSLFARIFGQKAWAATATIFSGSGDGGVTNLGAVNDPWATVHDAVSGTNSGTGAAQFTLGQAKEVSGVVQYQIVRAFLPFNTSSIPVDAVISSSTLTFTLVSSANGDNDGSDFVVVMQTDQPSSTALTNADFNNNGATTTPTEGSNRLDMSGWAASSTPAFTLNSTGIGWIRKSGQTSNCDVTAGVTCFGVREGHDVLNTAVSDNADNSFIARSSEYTGTANDPALIIDYIIQVPASGASATGIEVKGGLRIKGGVRFK